MSAMRSASMVLVLPPQSRFLDNTTRLLGFARKAPKA